MKILRNRAGLSAVSMGVRNCTMKHSSFAGVLAAALLMVGVAGCRLHVNKDSKGDEKQVQIDTPFGGLHVNTDQTTASDLGLPEYPGAVLVKGDDKHKSADVHMGFGDWQLRVRAVSYESADSQDKVQEFYKKAMARYGDVITCRDHQPVGQPKTTAQGLSCSDDDSHVNVNLNDKGKNIDYSRYELKAGSRRHQHIVAFEAPKEKRTRYALVYLDLPASGGAGKGSSD